MISTAVCVLLSFCIASAAAEGATFGSVQQMLGNMDRTDIDFEDGLAIDVLSPKNRTFVVTQNMKPLGAQFVTGTTGENFSAVLPYSYVIKLNETANDLIGKVELPYDPTNLTAGGLDKANTYVGRLSPDGKSWAIMDNQRNVHVAENKTRIIKMTSLDGEYLLLARNDIDSSNIFVQYGLGETRTANFSGGPGVQQSEFIDGLRFTVEANSKVRMNVQIKSPVDTKDIPASMQLLNSFSYLVNTSSSAAANATVLRKVKMQFPINPTLLSQAVNGGQKSNSSKSVCRAQSKSAQVLVAKRDTGANSSKFVLMSNQEVSGNQVVMTQSQPSARLDGEYVLLVSRAAQNTSARMECEPERKAVASGASRQPSLQVGVSSVLLMSISMLLFMF